ncbi:MAG TPA: hypothetical protein DD723_10570 [Candidatus Omnitrophica bacterium]|nr:MAG: hypothetical protein A2Z81_09780 [Omnitrophica WOR_2 bacterium GWA2_45_18]OGX19920.1 MAG: hypothetical protein A2Y04_04225 [Omnitrophica WOR_2 bacterium GWC2_45_7]HBR15960.1 hypothetical protein [Candidatus Omnitrophota bacterium]
MIGLYPEFLRQTTPSKGGFFDALKDVTGLDPLPFSCARAALVYGLRALGFNRMDEILVPPFLGQCVLSALARTAFPAMTPSRRTKGVLVVHQFGYRQALDSIEREAAKNGWVVLNDCAHTLFSSYEGEAVLAWGDFSVASFSKLYPCVLGGALFSRRAEMIQTVREHQAGLNSGHAHWVETAYEVLERVKRDPQMPGMEFEIDAVYGYLPNLVAFPPKAFAGLPSTKTEILEDIARRKKLLNLIQSYFPTSVLRRPGSDVVPFAVPVSGEAAVLERISARIRERFLLDVPVLHFDFACNMLNPDYRQALMIGCHQSWTEEMVMKMCEYIKGELT